MLFINYGDTTYQCLERTKKFLSELKIGLELEVINHLKEKAFQFPHGVILSNNSDRSVIQDDIGIILDFWFDYKKEINPPEVVNININIKLDNAFSASPTRQCAYNELYGAWQELICAIREYLRIKSALFEMMDTYYFNLFGRILSDIIVQNLEYYIFSYIYSVLLMANKLCRNNNSVQPVRL